MNQTLYRKAGLLLKHNEERALKKLLAKADFHDIGDILNHMRENRRKLFDHLEPQQQAEVILRLNEPTKRDVLPNLPIGTLARFLHFSDDDDATDVLQYLDKDKRKKILTLLKDRQRKKVEKLLQFEKETAGGLMDLDFIIVKDTYTLADIADKIQNHIDNEKQVPFVVLTSEDKKILGYIPHKNLIMNAPPKKPKSLAKPLPTIKYSMKQQSILHAIHNTKSDALGVVNEAGDIIGVIHISDLLKLAESEATEDIYTFAGIEKEESPHDAVLTKVRRRNKWLILNLGTAFLAASVVSLFENTIARMAILAAYMPIVAGEGGNAATQSLAVVVRSLAMDEIPWSEAKDIIIKEATTGMVNGILVGAVAGTAAFLLGAPAILGLVLACAMVFNLLIAGLFGAMIPFIIKSLKIDPAIASSIFVTTATDVVGFLVFLGLATILLM